MYKSSGSLVYPGEAWTSGGSPPFWRMGILDKIGLKLEKIFVANAAVIGFVPFT